jgi:hypothetical protein
MSCSHRPRFAAAHGIDRLGLTRDNRRFLDALCVDRADGE